MSNELPPLPQSFTILSSLQSGTEEVVPLDAVREYGRARERAAYERAIKAVEDAGGDNAYYHADAIRALGADK